MIDTLIVLLLIVLLLTGTAGAILLFQRIFKSEKKDEIEPHQAAERFAQIAVSEIPDKNVLKASLKDGIVVGFLEGVDWAVTNKYKKKFDKTIK